MWHGGGLGSTDTSSTVCRFRAYSPECVEVEFCELCLNGVLGRSRQAEGGGIIRLVGRASTLAGAREQKEGDTLWQQRMRYERPQSSSTRP
jgi:hypothetical protein